MQALYKLDTALGTNFILKSKAKKLMIDKIGKAQYKAGRKGFDTYEEFVRAMGSAGEGKHWHHIVEKYLADKKKVFKPKKVHSTRNMVPVEGSVHKQVTKDFSSRDRTTGIILRKELAKSKSFRKHFNEGLRVLRKNRVI